MKSILQRRALWALCVLFVLAPLSQAREAIELDERCVVNILNRTIYANASGDFVMDNVPSTLGQVRARATCTRESDTQAGQLITVSAQSDYFQIPTNGRVDVGQFFTGDESPIPVSLAFTDKGPLTLTGVGKTQKLRVMARWLHVA